MEDFIQQPDSQPTLLSADWQPGSGVQEVQPFTGNILSNEQTTLSEKT